MTDQEADAELLELQRIKSELLKKVVALKEESERISNQNRTYKLPPKKIFGDGYSAVDSRQSSRDGKTAKLLCDASRHASGVSFKNVDRRWLHHNTYMYTAYVKMKVPRFFLDLTVDTKGNSEFKILDVTCHFVGMADCYLLEIAPWVQRFATTKNFSHMMTDYSEQCVLRVKILRTLSNYEYVTVKQCEEDMGGFVILIYLQDDDEQNSMKIQWSLKYIERSCHIDHKFQTWAVGSGLKFMTENSELMKNFHRNSFNEVELKKMWPNLFNAIGEFKEVS